MLPGLLEAIWIEKPPLAKHAPSPVAIFPVPIIPIGLADVSVPIYGIFSHPSKCTIQQLVRVNGNHYKLGVRAP